MGFINDILHGLGAMIQANWGYIAALGGILLAGFMVYKLLDEND